MSPSIVSSLRHLTSEMSLKHSLMYAFSTSPEEAIRAYVTANDP